MKISNPFSKKISWKIGFGNSPQRDWKIILSTAAFVALVTIIVNTYIFITIDKDEVSNTEEGEAIGRAFNPEQLRETVLYYNDKADSFESIIRSATTTAGVDPSL